jgi:hypothetical protein
MIAALKSMQPGEFLIVDKQQQGVLNYALKITEMNDDFLQYTLAENKNKSCVIRLLHKKRPHYTAVAKYKKYAKDGKFYGSGII